MRLNRTGERPLLMSKQLRFNQCFRILREIQRDEASREALRETAFAWQVWDEAGPADRRRRRAFPGPGFAQQHGGEIFHSIPQVAIVPAHIVSKEIAP